MCASTFRIQLLKKIEENDCMTPRIKRAIQSRVDGVLAETMGEYAMEPFICNMSSYELLEIFAPNLLTYFQTNSLSLPTYSSVDDLLLDIELYSYK